MLSITIYCPDDHLAYDRTTLEKKGIGGGATARVRMAYALASLGHRVRLYINCPKERTEMGVETRHFSGLISDRSDIFIASTSGGKFDLSTLGAIILEHRLKVLLVHGIARPNGLLFFPFDFVYSPSNFIRGKVVNEWGVTSGKVFVSQHGVVEANFARRWRRPPFRDPFALLYAGHPSKGLETAVAVLRYLRSADRHFNLHVFGGLDLWGEAVEHSNPEEGITFHGTVGQRELAWQMQACNISLNLQKRQEPFGMAVIEAMRAGCVVLASPVGAYPEIISHGRDGFLVPGDPNAESTRRAAVDLIIKLIRNSAYTDYLRMNALGNPLNWDRVARAWEGHWDWFFSGMPAPVCTALGTCSECGGAWLPLADGLHCTRCGNYQKKSLLQESS